MITSFEGVQLVVWIVLIHIFLERHEAAAIQVGGIWGRAVSLAGSTGRSMKQLSSAAVQHQTALPCGQFSPILDRTNTYGDWGGRWGHSLPTTSTQLSSQAAGSSTSSFAAAGTTSATNTLSSAAAAGSAAASGAVFSNYGAPMVGGQTAGGSASSTAGAAATSNNPGSVGVVTTQATAFDTGYCVPRQSFVIVNVTALACNPGSNLTRWDGQEVCARIDCEAKLDNTNIINAAAFCRTVVEQPRYICPNGCEVITQLFTNRTSNVTRQVTRCSCRAGNQPCPGTYVGCICQPALITTLNATAPYVLCSTQQNMCTTNCQLTANKLGPLCPIIPDSTLPDDPLSGPVYPRWSWDVAGQGQATAAVAPGTPIGRHLLTFLRSKQLRGGSTASSSGTKVAGWRVAWRGATWRQEPQQWQQRRQQWQQRRQQWLQQASKLRLVWRKRGRPEKPAAS